MKPCVIIPARLQSTRLPGKLLYEVEGKSVLGWLLSNFYDKAPVFKGKAVPVYVATDSNEIKIEAEKYGAKVLMTPSDVNSGTERIVSILSEIREDFIVNIQADEPLMEPIYIERFLKWINAGHSGQINKAIFTIGTRTEDRDIYENPNNVKIVLDRNEKALYFSRSPIPFYRDGKQKSCYLHYGIYGYSKKTLVNYKKMESELEKAEKLEQLKFLENGGDIFVWKVDFQLIGIDTQNDIEKFKKYIKLK